MTALPPATTDNPPPLGHGLHIRAASDLLGVPAPTLRSWELRYGMPLTLRSPGGHRRYDAEALVQLGLMRDEVAIGRPPAEAARRVRDLIDEQGPSYARIAGFMAGSTAMDANAIRAVLDVTLADLGLGTTLDDVVMPAMRQVGSWWASGRCDIGQEHYTTETVRGWLERIITLAPAPASDRWVLLAVGPRDLHTLGLKSLAALLVTDGIGCRLLDSRTPARVVLAAAAATTPAAVVVVSHLATNRRPAVESLKSLADLGYPTFYAGNAFLLATARKHVPGTYLGETLTQAAAIIRAAVANADPDPPHPAGPVGSTTPPASSASSHLR